MNALTQHALSAAFPALSADEFQALQDSIADIGVQNPITLLDGQVLDGWNRYRAALALDIECPSVDLAGWIDPRAFVMAQNKTRRHVTQAQLAMAATAVYAWQPRGGDRRSESKHTECALKSTAQMAEIAGVHRNTIVQAQTVTAQAAPAVVAAVKSGALGLPKAAAIAKLPKAEQAAAIDKPLPKKQAKPAPKPAQPAPPAPADDDESAPPPDDYTELDAAHDQITALQADLVVARMGDVPEEERTQAAEHIASLQAQVKSLTAQLAAVTLSRDSLMHERNEMLAQLQRQRAALDRLNKK